jgi:hypothetical protein
MIKLSKKITFFFFILLVLLLLFIPFFNPIVASLNKNDLYVNSYNFYDIDNVNDNDIVELSSSSSFSANSNIGMLIPKGWIIGKPAWWNVLTYGKYPDQVRFYLKKPSGETVYFVQNQIELIAEDSSSWTIDFGVLDLRIPMFPEQGAWIVEIFIFSYLLGLENALARWSYSFYVGESSIMDNLMAPIYFYWDVFGWVASGDEISFALPGIFWLSAIIWIPITFIFILWYTKTSIYISKYLFKKKYDGGRKQNG